ncbi:hypothetical protein D9M73_261280 [compost metagenome]
MQQHRRANAHRRTGHGGHYRFAAFEQVEHEMEHRAVEVARRLLDEVSDVVAGSETLTGAGDQYRIDFRVAVGLFQRFGQVAVHGAGQGVFLGGAIEAQGQQAAFAFNLDGISHGRSRV